MRLAPFLTAISPVGETLAAMEQGMAALETDAVCRNAQLSPVTADEALSLWEADYSLPLEGELAARRARLCAVLSGGQTMTPAYLESLAVLLAGADKGVAREDFAAWQVRLLALYDGRLPTGIDALEAAVERLKPAHLTVTVESAARLREETCLYPVLTGGMLLQLPVRSA